MSRVLTILVAFGIAAVVLAIPSIALVLSPDIRQEATRTTRAEVIAVVEAALRAAYASESAERIEVACQEAQTSGRESVARRFTSPFQDVTDVEYGETVFDVFLTDYCSAG